MTPEEHIRGTGDQAADVAELHRIVVEIAPELPCVVQGAFLSYGPFRYRTKSGCEGDWARIGIAERKGGVTIHLACGVGGPVPGTTAGVGCLKIKNLAKVGHEALRREIARAATADLPLGLKAEPQGGE